MNAMTRRERVTAALNHTETDYVPHHIDFTMEERERVADYLGDDAFEGKIGNHLHATGWDANLRPDPARPGFFIDDYGVLWDRTGPDKDIGVIDHYRLSAPDMKLFAPPPIDEAAIEAACREAFAATGDRFTIFNIGFSLFERAWTLRGMEHILMDMVENPEFMDDLLDTIVDINLHVVDIALRFPFDAILFGDDWGQQRGLIMGPKHWRRFIKPRLARMYGRVRGAGRFTLQHSCGDILSVYPDLIEVGLNCHNTFQPEIFDIEAVKREYGGDLSFWGGISTQRLLPYASPEGVKDETRRIMGILGKGGGYIAAPTHAVPRDVPPENIAALIEVFAGQGQRS